MLLLFMSENLSGSQSQWAQMWQELHLTEHPRNGWKVVSLISAKQICNRLRPMFHLKMHCAVINHNWFADVSLQYTKLFVVKGKYFTFQYLINLERQYPGLLTWEAGKCITDYSKLAGTFSFRTKWLNSKGIMKTIASGSEKFYKLWLNSCIKRKRHLKVWDVSLLQIFSIVNIQHLVQQEANIQ